MKKILLLVTAMVSVVSVGCKAELFGTRSTDVTIINDSNDTVYASGKHGGNISIPAGDTGTIKLELHEPSRHEAFLKIRAFSPQQTVLHITGNDIDTQDITIKEGDKDDITVTSKSGGRTKKRKREEREEEERPKKKYKKERREKEEEQEGEEEDQD